MDLLTIFLLTFTLLSGCIRETKTIEHNKIKYQKVKEADTDKSSSCPCFTKNPQGRPISKLIAPTGTNQRRLVIYVYKTDNSDFRIYVPNKEKQIVFPDLTFDEGDNLKTINLEKVIDLYNINSDLAINNIPKELEKQEVIDGTLQPDVHLPSRNPTDLLTAIPHDNYDTNHYDDDMVLDQAGILKFLKNHGSKSDISFPGNLLTFPSMPGQTETKTNHPKISDFPLYDDLNLYSSDPEKISIQDISTNYPTNKDFYTYDDFDAIPSVSGQISETDANKNYPSLIDFIPNEEYNIIPSAPGQISESEINKNQKSINDPSLHKDLNVIHPIVEEIAVPIETNINQPSISDPLLQKENNISPAAAAQIKAPEIIKNSDVSSNQGPPAIPLKSKHDSSQTSKPVVSNAPAHDFAVFPLPPDYTTKKFEQWFKGNKNFISNINLPFLQKINHGKFYIILLKALHENGISISETGDLLDWSGNTLDISKLKLLPVILGNSVDLNNLLSQNKCFTPFNLSFLQGILVTLTYPPRILGVIPLGKILKETAQYTQKPCYLDTNKEAASCAGGSCQIEAAEQNEDITIESDRTKSLSNDRLGLQANLNGIMEASDLFDSFYGNIKGINNKPMQDFSEDDILGLRIIGGKPATSSGIPVSSKGRSAGA